MHFPTPGVHDGTVGATPSAVHWSSAKLEQRITITKASVHQSHGHIKCLWRDGKGGRGDFKLMQQSEAGIVMDELAM